jgi:WD40 repeat protein
MRHRGIQALSLTSRGLALAVLLVGFFIVGPGGADGSAIPVPGKKADVVTVAPVAILGGSGQSGPAAQADVGVRAVAFSVDSKFVAVVSRTETRIWSVPAYKPVVTLRDPASKGVNSAQFSQDGKLATGDGNGHVYLWSHTRVQQRLTDPASKGVSDVAFTSNSEYLAAGDANGRVYFWSLATGTNVATVTDPHSKGVSAVALSYDTKYLAAADRNGNTYVFATPADTLAATLHDPAGRAVNTVGFSQNDKILVTADSNGHAYLWSHAHVQWKLADPHSKGIKAIAFAPNGKFLATGDANGATYVWSLATHRIVATFVHRGDDGVNAVAFTPSGRYLAAGDGNGVTYIYVVPKVAR